MFWTGGIGGGWQLIPTAIPAGVQLPVNLETHAGYDVKWDEAEGYLRYVDLAGNQWQTQFRYRQNPKGQWWVEVLGVGKTEDLGEHGWEN